MKFAIINAGLSLFFALAAISVGIPAYFAIPNGVLAIMFYMLATI